MGVSRLLGFCVAFLFASSVSAAVTIDLGPTDYRKFGPNPSHTPSGIRSSVPQTVKLPPSGASLPVTRRPVIPYGSVASGAKTFLRVNPTSAAASAAVTALFLGLDWVFRPEYDQWMKQGEPTIEYVNPTSGGFDPNSGPPGLFPTAEAACAVTLGCVNSGACIPEPVPGSWYGFCTKPDGERFGGYSIVSPVCPPGSTFTPLGCAVTIEGEWEELTEADWQALESSLPASSPVTVADAASDIQRRIGGPLPGYHDTQISGPSSVTGPTQTTTSTDPSTGSTNTTQTTTQINISYGDTTITTTNTTVTNTYVDGQHTGTETTTETPGDLPVTEPAAAEWPAFCEWASIVCDWIDWTREEPDSEPDLPEVMDDDFYQQKSIQFGAKTCPPDYDINIAFLDTTVGVSMQPLCDFAGIIYYMVMAAAYIIAAYISIGVARNG